MPEWQNFGYHGSIFDLNKRVESIWSEYQARFGQTPSPGLVFDLVRAPVDDIKGLLSVVPLSGTAARLQGDLQKEKAQSPYEYFIKDKNGDLVVNNPLMEKIRQQIHADPPKPGELGFTHQDLLKASKQYPTVRAGEVIPLNSVNLDGLFGAISTVDKWVGEGQLKVGANGMSVEQIDKLIRQAQTGPGSGETLKKIGHLTLIRGALDTVQKAQKELNDRMGTNLPVTGIFSDDWNKAVSNWIKTPNYYRQAAIYQSQQAGFGDDYGRFAKAINFKQHAVKKHGFFQYAIAGLPLQAFSHGGGFGLVHGLFDDIINPKTLGFSTPFHALTHAGGLVLGGVGGTVTQAKAYAVASNAFASDILAAGPGGGNKTFDKAKADFKKKLLHSDPTWAHVLFPDLAAHPKGWVAAVDKITNLAGDLILLRGAKFTGETVPLADKSAALASTRIRVGSHWAFQDLQEGNIGRAASMLEGGSGAERLAAVAAPLVAKGKLSEQQFLDHVADLYSSGSTTLKYGTRDVTIQDVARPFDSLKLSTLPTPGKATQVPKRGLRNAFDRADATMRSKPWLPNQAANFVSFVRSEFGHAVPPSARSYFEPKLPERVHDLVLKEFSNASLANEFESRLVRLRATENVVGIQKLDNELSDMLRAKYPEGREASIQDPFKPMLETEAPSRFGAFAVAKQGKYGEGALNSTRNLVRGTNRMFNKLASYSSRLIIASPILAWKHVTDYFRRAVAQDSIAYGLSAEQKGAKTAIEALANSDPQLSRALGSFLARTKNSEVRYMTGNGATLRAPGATDFSTGEHFGGANYMRAAGGYLRRRIDSKALSAYERSSEGDISPLVSLVLHDGEFQGLYRAAKKASRVAPEDPGISVEDYAQVIWNDYQKIQDSAVAAGEHDFLGKAQQILQQNRGTNVDQALGRYIKEAGIDFRINGAEVERIGGFDAVSQKAIGLIMTANKWNRSQLAKKQMYSIFSDLKASGASDTDAMLTAMSGAEKLVTHHMLDFANRLQVEQDLRWLSYFATKHRLYWKWVVSTFTRNPGYAALVYDFKNQLDDHGNLNFSVFGQKLSVPATRLTWVPGRDYSELSPIAKGVMGAASGEGFFQSARGTFGNVFTRNDTPVRMGIRLARMEFGETPSTYAQAVAGMDSKTKARLYKTFNDYANHYYEEHGHYPSQADTVKHGLWSTMGEELWRANLPLPVESQYAEDPGSKLIGTYLGIVDPAKRRTFLDKNPILAEYFGVYKDPVAYQHNREYFRSFNSARDTFRNERRQIWAQAQQQGYWTPDLNKQSKESSLRYSGVINKLILQDAAQTGKVNAEGKKVLANPNTDFSKVNPDRYILERGSWGKKIKTDPLTDAAGTYHKLFPGIPMKELEKAAGGFDLKQARQELQLLNDPKYVSATFGSDPEAESQIKTRKQELLQYISDFQSAPSNPVSKAKREYQTKYADPFWAGYEKRFKQIANLPKGKKELAYAEFRAWRDAQDKPVVIQGVKFPSPIRAAWVDLDPQTRKARLAKLASSEWGHLANYEKELLTGKKPGPHVSEAWAQFDKLVSEYRTKYPGVSIKAEQKLGLAKQMGKYYEGFYKDYLFSLENKERRFEATNLYQNMPSDTKAKYDQYIGTLARVEVKRLNGAGYSKSEAAGIWKNYVDQQVLPWLNDTGQTRLRKELAPYGPDFLYSLVN
jgi:hypothetical protein